MSVPPLGAGVRAGEIPLDKVRKDSDMTVTVEGQVQDVATVAGFTVPAGLLRDMLAGAIVGASKDVTLPSLCAVRLEWDASGVTAVSTDRYRLIVVELPADSAHRLPVTVEGEGSALLSRADVEALVKALPKSAPKTEHLHRVNLSRVGDVVIVRHEAIGEGVTVRECRVVMADFPSWRSLLPTDDTFDNSDGVSSVGWNVSYMADVAKLPTGRKAVVRWRFSASNRPAVADFPMSDSRVSFRYLLMPVRIAA